MEPVSFIIFSRRFLGQSRSVLLCDCCVHAHLFALQPDKCEQASLNNIDFKRWYQTTVGISFIFVLCMFSFENILLCCCHVGRRQLFSAPIDVNFQNRLRLRGALLHLIWSRPSQFTPAPLPCPSLPRLLLFSCHFLNFFHTIFRFPQVCKRLSFAPSCRLRPLPYLTNS